MKHASKDIQARVGLTKRQVCFLDKLIMKIRFHSGKKFTRSQVIEAFFKNTKDLPINIKGLKNEEELTEQILLTYREKV